MKLIIQLLLLTVLPISTSAQEFLISSGSKMYIRGGSTLGSWECSSEKIMGKILTVTASGTFKTVISVPVKSFSCGSALMENDMQEALKAEEHPTIWYTTESREKVENLVQMCSDGILSVAGVSKVVKFKIDMVKDNIIEGYSSMKMTDFNIEPPSAFFGLIKAEDKMEIEFKLILTEKVDRNERARSNKLLRYR
jgi:hypothetical protein